MAEIRQKEVNLDQEQKQAHEKKALQVQARSLRNQESKTGPMEVFTILLDLDLLAPMLTNLSQMLKNKMYKSISTVSRDSRNKMESS